MKLSEIRRALAESQVTPSKTLGQNFLHDQNLARWIVAQLDIRPDDTLVEIGPGLGALTGNVLETGVNLIALEKDARLVAFLNKRFDGCQHLKIIHGDALDFDVRTLWQRQPVKVFGNLPYYVSTPLLFHFASLASPVERAVFLLQRELAERLAATRPGTKDYGALSLVIGRRWEVKLLRTLSPCMFLPEPKVDSALVLMTPRPVGSLPFCDASCFESLVKLGFSQRRKQLRKLLRGNQQASGDKIWCKIREKLEIADTARGEELTLGQWVELTNIVSPIVPASAQDAAGEIFDVVNANDVVTGAESRGVVHTQNLLHRAVHVFVFNDKNELFLQKRSAWKDKHPGKWDSSAAGHLDCGESYLQAAQRELEEELGLPPDAAATRLAEIGSLPARETTGWEFIRLYKAVHNGPFHWPQAEIEWGGFFPWETIVEWTSLRPGDFAPGFLECLNLLRP